jgi:hypothetical protein
MKKNICPYLGISEKCVHSSSTYNKSPICPYNNPLKCRMYNEWISKTSSLRKLPSTVLNDIRNTMEEYQRRWIK